MNCRCERAPTHPLCCQDLQIRIPLERAHNWRAKPGEHVQHAELNLTCSGVDVTLHSNLLAGNEYRVPDCCSLPAASVYRTQQADRPCQTF